MNGLLRTKKEGGLSGQPKSESYAFKKESVVDLLIYRPSCDIAHALPICILKTLQQISLRMLKEIQIEGNIEK